MSNSKQNIDKTLVNDSTTIIDKPDFSIYKSRKKKKTSKVFRFLSEAFDSISANLIGDDDKTDFYSSFGDVQDNVTHSVVSGKSERNTDNKYGKVSDQYSFKETFAEGGQGKLSKAVDKDFHRVVAMKSLRDELIDNKEIRDAFIDEAEITAQLEHPSVVPVYGLYSDDKNGLHLAMKLIQGRTLREHINGVIETFNKIPLTRIKIRERKLLRQRLEFFVKLCDALSFVHSKNVIHRDLKPENIMIGSFNETYIMDWGIAEKFDPENPAPVNVISGSPRYISPDILNKRPLDQRSDIYLLGIILYEIVFLKRAFPQHSHQDALRAAKQGIVAPFTHAFKIKIDSDLKAIISKALEFDPDERYQSAAELAEDVRNYVNDEIVSVCPHPLISQLQRYTRRHSQFLMIALAFMIFTFLALGILAYSKQIESQYETTKRDEAINRATASAFATAASFDSAYTKLIAQLGAMGNEIAMRLDMDPKYPIKQNCFDYRDGHSEAKAPGGYKFSDVLKFNVSYDAIAYKLPMNEKVKNVQSYLNAMSPMLSEFNNVIQKESSLDGFDYCPAVLIYAGFSNGMQFCHPYKSTYRDEYDPRIRSWYLTALEAPPQKVVWSAPYLDEAAPHEIVLAACMPIVNQNGTYLGALGADFQLKRLCDLLKKSGNSSSFATCALLVTQNGEIYADSSREQAPTVLNSTLMVHKFKYDHLLKLMWARRNGNIFEDSSRNYLYVYSYIKSLNWLYIERIDFNMLISNNM